MSIDVFAAEPRPQVLLAEINLRFAETRFTPEFVDELSHALLRLSEKLRHDKT